MISMSTTCVLQPNGNIVRVNPGMPIEEVKGWLEGVDEALKSARNDLKKLE